MYRGALEVADQVIFVGPNSHRSKATREEIAAGRFVAFTSVRLLERYIRETAIPGELILLKSARNLHLERIALSWDRNILCWPDSCGVRKACPACGRLDQPATGTVASDER
jgi:UDP-N-acetylmuramoyl-tripeptide--D-alanyl-D-alanine ligase